MRRPHPNGRCHAGTPQARAFLDVSAAHYPERLGMFFVVDAPRIFNTLWAAIEAYVDPKTRQKIRFVP